MDEEEQRVLGATGAHAEVRRGAPLPERMLLFDVKTIHAGGGIYRGARARDDQCGAVDARAHQVGGGDGGGEYGAHARRLDARFSPPLTSPIAAHLRSFTQVRGLVFGQYADTSPDVDDLVRLAACRLAVLRAPLMGARTVAEAAAFFTASLRRRLGTVASRAMARHRLRRVQYVGVPRAVLDARQQRAGGLVAPAAELQARAAALRQEVKAAAQRPRDMTCDMGQHGHGMSRRS